MPRKLPEPRFIRPETVDIGDTIRVTYPETGGIVVTKTGTVAAREDHGACRFFLTAEGSHLLVWEPGGPRNVRVTLLARAERQQEALFEFPPPADIGEIRQRIS